MKETPKNLKTVLSLAELPCPTERDESETDGVETDSRSADLHGKIFVCMRGHAYDSHRDILRVAKAGAVLIVVQKGWENPDDVIAAKALGVPILSVSDSRAAYACLCSAMTLHAHRGLKLIAVTGTNGKTTITQLLAHLFAAAGKRCAAIGTVSPFGQVFSGGAVEVSKRQSTGLANMTTPDPDVLYPLLREYAESGVEYVFMEASSHALALQKLAPIHFTAAVFTNLTQDHLDFHKTRENYAAAKEKLFFMTDFAVLNIDDSFGKILAKRIPCPCLKCSVSPTTVSADFLAQDIACGKAGSSFTVRTDAKTERYETPMFGEYQVMNCLEAIALAAHFGVDGERVHRALADFSGVCGRGEWISPATGESVGVMIDYAHTPDAMEQVLRSARRICGEKTKMTVLFGCGGEREKEKRALMGEIAARYADTVVLTSDNARGESTDDILADIQQGIPKEKKFTVIPDREEAIRYAIDQAAYGDAVLLLGKGHERYEIIGNRRLPFDEAAIAADALRKKGRNSV